MVDSAEILKARLKEALARSGVTATDLAEACDVSVQGAAKWVRTGKVAREHILTVSRRLGVTADWLLGGEPGSRIAEDAPPYQHNLLAEKISKLSHRQQSSLESIVDDLLQVAPSSPERESARDEKQHA